MAGRDGRMLPDEAEQLVAVKTSWRSRHELRPPGQRRRLEEVLSDVITACIDEFYRIEPRPALEPAHRDARRLR